MRFSDEAVLRLVVAVVLGGMIGAEREATEQPAGLRTHIAVCLGAALFGVVSTLGFDEFEARRATTNIQVDVTRVASQVVVGIGFLGAGMIFRQGTAVRNLTTAASLWVVAAIGLTAGVGDIGTAAVGTVIMLLALVALLPVRGWIRTRVARQARELEIRLAAGADPGGVVQAVHDLDDVHVKRTSIEKADGAFVVVVELTAAPGSDIDVEVSNLAARNDVVSLGEVGARSS
jgi:putative Mg2+ transporter-C (MgtC) family protein